METRWIMGIWIKVFKNGYFRTFLIFFADERFLGCSERKKRSELRKIWRNKEGKEREGRVAHVVLNVDGWSASIRFHDSARSQRENRLRFQWQGEVLLQNRNLKDLRKRHYQEWSLQLKLTQQGKTFPFWTPVEGKDRLLVRNSFVHPVDDFHQIVRETKHWQNGWMTLVLSFCI